MPDPSLLLAKATNNQGNALKHPTARAFNPSEWEDALLALEHPTERDITLANSAIWFGRQIKTLRKYTDQILAPLNRTDAVLLAVAQLNREYATLQSRLSRARHEERKREFVDIHAASQRMISNGLPESALPADDINDSLVDTLPVWLFQASKLLAKSSTKTTTDFTQMGVDAVRGFSLEKTLSKLWQQCLWLDWRLSMHGKQLTLAPHDRAAATLRLGWLFRQQGLAAQHGFVDLAAEISAQKANLKSTAINRQTIIAQENRSGRRRVFITGRASRRSASYMQNHMWTSVEASYLEIFLDTPLPKLGLSCNQLQNIWCIVADACNVLSKKCSDRRPVDKSTIRDWASICNKTDLLEAVSYCTKLPSAETELALNFLTYDEPDFQRGVWSKPLIRLNDQNFLLMCRSPLEIGNPVRRVEQWLERGGLSDQLSGAKRGSTYETWVRNEISNSLENNDLLQNNTSISSPIKPGDRSIGDIDAAIRINDLILVLEVKCLLTPAEPIEHYRYQNKLEDAAKQAIRKARWLENNINSHRKEFCLGDNESVEIKPVVVTNQGYGLSLEIDECLICDFHTLSNYLRDNTIVVGAAFSGLTGKTSYSYETLYKNEEDARRYLLKRIKEAPTLKRYIDRTIWFNTIIPCHPPPTDKLFVAGARLSEEADIASQIAAAGLGQ